MGLALRRRTDGVRKLHAGALTRSRKYKNYCLAYRYDFLFFILKHSSKKPTWQQVILIVEMSQPNFSLSTVSGHSTGKTWVIAWFIVWQITVYPFSTMLLTAPKLGQMRKAIWRELSKILDEFFYVESWLEPYFVRLTKVFYAVGYPDAWAAFLGTAPKGKEDNLSGTHGEKHTIIIDEASGVSDALLGVLMGSLTGLDNSIAMFSQGLRNSGPFYDSHHTKKDSYKTYAFDAEQAPEPLVTKAWIEKMLKLYGGFFSDTYQIKVKGGWPGHMEGMLIPRAWAELCGNIVVKHEMHGPPGVVITVDVSGSGRNSTVYLVARVSGYRGKRLLTTEELIIHDGISKGPQVVRRIKALMKKYKAFNPTLGVDGGGAGSTVCDFLEEESIPVHRILWGRPAIDNELYGSQRAEAAYWVREAIQYYQMTFRGVSSTTQSRIFDEFANIPYHYTDRGIKLWTKPRMKDEGIASPDIFDAYCFAYLLPYVPMLEASEDFSRLATARARAKADFEEFERQLREEKNDDGAKALLRGQRDSERQIPDLRAA